MLNLVFGVLMIVCGFASLIYGNFMNNDFSSQLAHYSSGGDPGNIWMICGGVAILIGILMVLLGCEELKPPKTDKVIFFCKKCKSTYSELPGTKNNCPDCKTPLVETQINRDYWRSLTNAERELARNKIDQDVLREQGK